MGTYGDEYFYAQADNTLLIIDAPAMINSYDGSDVTFCDQAIDILECCFKDASQYSLILTYDGCKNPCVYSFDYDPKTAVKLDKAVRKKLNGMGFTNIIMSYTYNYRGVIRDYGSVDESLTFNSHIGGLLKDICMKTDEDNWVYIINSRAPIQIERWYSILDKYDDHWFVANIGGVFQDLYDFETFVTSNDFHGKEELSKRILNPERTAQAKHLYKAEVKAKETLMSMGYTPIAQYAFPDLKDKTLLRYDIGFTDKKGKLRLIELDGEQHYKPVSFGDKNMKQVMLRYETQLEHDRQKDEYAKQHDIPLLRIPYTEDVVKEIKDWLKNPAEQISFFKKNNGHSSEPCPL